MVRAAAPAGVAGCGGSAVVMSSRGGAVVVGCGGGAVVVSSGGGAVSVLTRSLRTAPGPGEGSRRASSLWSATAVPAGGHGSPPLCRGSPLRIVRPYVAMAYSFRADSELISCGTTWNRSPTTPKSAISKIGASGSLLIATMVLAVCMPARCWMAPETPIAT